MDQYITAIEKKNVLNMLAKMNNQKFPKFEQTNYYGWQNRFAIVLK